MAEVPLYIMANGLFIGASAHGWEAAELDAERSWTVSPSRASRFSPSNLPKIWHYQAVTAAAISSISTADPAVVTLSGSVLATDAGALRSSGPIEVFIAGVTGTDAASINGVHQGTLTSGTTVRLDSLDTSAMSFSAASATLRYPGLVTYTGASLLGNANSNTDPTYGGAAPSPVWGPEAGLLANVHEHWGDPSTNNKVAYLLKYHSGSALMARPLVAVTGVTKAATTTITFGAVHGIANEGAKGQWVVFSGFTGDFEALNGRHQVFYASTTTVTVAVDSSAFSGAYGGSGATAAIQRRWLTTLDEEVYDDFYRQLANMIACIEDTGDTASVKGIALSFGYGDANIAATANTKRTVGISAISATGNPTTITTSTAHGLSEPAAASARLCCKIEGVTGNASAINGTYECRVTGTSSIEIDYENADTASLGSATISIGDPIYFLREQLSALITQMRTDCVALSGTGTAATIPVALVIPTGPTSTEWTGATAYYTAAQLANARSAIQGVADLDSYIQAIDIDDLERAGTSNVWLSPRNNIELGDRVWATLTNIESQKAVSENDGVPVYWLLGESLAAGTIDRLAYYYDGDPNYNGQQVGDRGTKIWDFTTGAFAEYRTNAIGAALKGNSNTHPYLHVLRSVDGLVGCDPSLILELKTRHPNEDVYLVKLGVHGSTLQSATIGRTITAVSTGSTTAEITLDSDEPHNRWQAFTVVFSGMAEAGITGIEDGISYTATPISYTKFSVTTATTVGGSYGDGATASVPSFAWQESAGDLWSILESTKTAVYAALRDDGKLPDCRGVFWWQGLNDATLDASNPGLADGYEAALGEFVDDLRTLLTTRSEPNAELPIVVAKVRTFSGYSGGATTQTAVATVQAAQAAVAGSKSQVALADMDNSVDADLETNETPVNDDDVHLTMRGYIEGGFRLNNALSNLDTDGAEPVISSSGSGEGFATV